MRYKDGIFIKSLKLIPSTFLSYVNPGILGDEKEPETGAPRHPS